MQIIMNKQDVFVVIAFWGNGYFDNDISIGLNKPHSRLKACFQRPQYDKLKKHTTKLNWVILNF